MRAELVGLLVWDGYCRSEITVQPACPEALETQPDGDGIYLLTLASPDQFATIDVLISNPRVRDRYVHVEGRFSWLPRIEGDSGTVAEFDTISGDKEQIQFRLRYSDWPTRGGVATFAVVETGPDLSSPTRIVKEVRFRQRSRS